MPLTPYDNGGKRQKFTTSGNCVKISATHSNTCTIICMVNIRLCFCPQTWDKCFIQNSVPTVNY